jgi:hypothetical protein
MVKKSEPTINGFLRQKGGFGRVGTISPERLYNQLAKAGNCNRGNCFKRGKMMRMERRLFG